MLPFLDIPWWLEIADVASTFVATAAIIERSLSVDTGLDVPFRGDVLGGAR